MKSRFLKTSTLIMLPLMGLTMFGFTVGKEKKTEASMKSSEKPTDFTQFLDKSVAPGKDFFLFANGTWIKNNTPIPATESNWTAFNEIRDFNRKVVRGILENAAADKTAPKGSNIQKLGDYFASGMDSAAIEKAGVTPLKPEFDAINTMKDKNDVVTMAARLQRKGINALFGFYVDQDAKASTMYIATAGQAGIGLPDRDYYFKTDDKMKNIRVEYVKHISNMFQLLGDAKEKADKEAQTVMDVETSLASASMNRLQMRDPNAVYHKMTVAEASASAPNIGWENFMKAIGVPPVKEMNVGQPDFFKELSVQLGTRSMDDWKTYLRFRLVSSTAGKLNSAFVNESFHFYGTIMNGTKVLEPRWKRIQASTDGNLGELLGQEYVKVAFKPEAKAKAKEMVNNLMAALKERINLLDWMSAATKKEALHKLSTIVVKIGYPDQWHDYSKLEINRGPYILNEMRATEFETQRNLDKIGKPIDRIEWGMTPPTVNAYYNPAMNEIVFPAGILQKPFFDPYGDDAMNYGSIGAVIGHELTHGFDDEGRQFDADGNLKDWWTKEDAEQFDKRTGAVVKQFNGYVAQDTMHINGKLTLGENIADLGGLTIAYQAYKNSLKGKPEPKVINGYTGDQRFFLAWAQGWRCIYRPEALTRQLLTNPHSPGMFRVIGPLSNMPEFYKAFDLKDGDAMKRPEADRAKIW